MRSKRAGWLQCCARTGDPVLNVSGPRRRMRSRQHHLRSCSAFAKRKKAALPGQEVNVSARHAFVCELLPEGLLLIFGQRVRPDISADHREEGLDEDLFDVS